MDSVGGRRFADATKKNVGRIFAIVLDGRVVSAPVIQEPILGGQGQITGRFTFQETEDLALLLRAGALPAPLVILEERTVGNRYRSSCEPHGVLPLERLQQPTHDLSRGSEIGRNGVVCRRRRW